MIKYNQKTIDNAIVMIKNQIREPESYITNPNHVKVLCQLELSTELNEVFGCLFLDNQHGIICFEKLFFGTINAASVHPRVIIQRALFHNSAAIILTHNHPSGICEPSVSDVDITNTLVKALKYIDVRVLDHIIVAGKNTYSFAEFGKL